MSSSTAFHTSAPSLTSNDSAVLQALFDAESSPSAAVTIDPKLPPLPEYLNISPKLQESLQAREMHIISTLQSPHPTKEAIQSAIKNLDLLIATHPTYPTAYANRAQALRILIEASKSNTPLTASTPSSKTTTTPIKTVDDEHEYEHVTALLADLGQAITLASPRSPADPISALQARVLADSHTHRGYLVLKISRQLKDKEREGGASIVPDRLRGLEPDQLEEMASRDFFFGGRYGNKVAQQLAVQTNPYAKMCGAIVKEALRKEIRGE